MIRLSGLCRSAFALVVVPFLWTGVARAQLVNRDWNTGNGIWNVATNWTPTTSAPDNGTPAGVAYNVQIGNLGAAANASVTFVPVSGTSDTIQTLTLSNGADLLTNGGQLNVTGVTTTTGAGSTIRVDPHNTPGTPAFQSLDLNLNVNSELTMNGGIAAVSGELEINVGSVLSGFGTVNVGDGDAVVESAFENSGSCVQRAVRAGPEL